MTYLTLSVLVFVSFSCAQVVRLPPGQRVVVIADIHGDVEALKETLLLGNLTDREGRWVGGTDILVQLGDLVDRGAWSDKCVELIFALAEEASLVGGEVVTLIGNHELLNMQGALEYVSQEEMNRIGEARNTLFSPSGYLGRQIVQRSRTVYVNGATLFVHAGITPADAALGETTLNEKVRRLLGNKSFDDEIFGDAGPFWTRHLTISAQEGDCGPVAEVLSAVSRAENRRIKHIIVGHTIQRNQQITRFCDGRLIAADIGMSYALGLGNNRRALTIVTRDHIKTLHKGEAHEQLSLAHLSQGSSTMFTFTATILSPVLAIASFMMLLNMIRTLKTRLCR